MCIYTCKKYVWHVYITIYYIYNVIYTDTSSEGVVNDTQTTESSKGHILIDMYQTMLSGLRILHIIKLK